jgi:pimeloyl-ACP methyl ester carboxylesterase
MVGKILRGLLALAVISIAAYYVLSRPAPADTRFSGAYAFDDGSIILIAPREGPVLRYRTMNGETGVLWPVGEAAFEGGKQWAERAPVVNQVRFRTDGQDRPAELTFTRVGRDERHARALPLTERIFEFKSGDLTLRGKLVMPAGDGPFPGVVFVHGSEEDSAVDYYYEPYLTASHGFASLVFDKRGTGRSHGSYTQNFNVLADDVLAAVNWLREQEHVDPAQIHLEGASQGGWVAPLAAKQDGHIKSVLVVFGTTRPVVEEDRWTYEYTLRRHGFGDVEVAAADRLNAIVDDILVRRQDRWNDLAVELERARKEKWFGAVAGSDSALGLFTGTKLPLWCLRVYAWWKLDGGDQPFMLWNYDPVPTLASLDTPSFWILGGEDSSLPTPATVTDLDKLKASGKPIDYIVYPGAEHGIIRFEDQPDGERRYTGYVPEYFEQQVAALRGDANRPTSQPASPPALEVERGGATHD